MAKFKVPSKAVIEARARRAEANIRRSTRTEWFIDKVLGSVNLEAKQRVEIATEYVKSKILLNISRPVTKGNGVVTNRSISGEYPKADTTQLMKTLFSGTIEPKKGVVEGYIATPLEYGVILELSESLNRRWMSRTLDEERNRVANILGKPVK